MIDKSMARPDKVARRGQRGYALCGWCNNRLAYLWSFVTLVEMNDPNAYRWFHRTILLPAEWTFHDDGIWRYTNHTYQGRPSVRRLYKAVPQQSRVWKTNKSEIVVVRHPTQTPIVCKCNTCGELQTLDPTTLGVSLYFSIAEEEQVLLNHDYFLDEDGSRLRGDISRLRHDIEKIFGAPTQARAIGGQILYLVLLDRGTNSKLPVLLLDKPLSSYLNPVA